MALVVVAHSLCGVRAAKQVIEPWPGATQIAESGPASTADSPHVLLGVVFLAIGAASGLYFVDKGLYAFKPNPGISLLAVFYVFAQALERIMELAYILIPAAGATRSSFVA